MIKRALLVLKIAFLCAVGSSFAGPKNPILNASMHVLGGPLPYYSDRPGAFLGNPANLGLNGWNRISLHMNRGYGFNAFVTNGFLPGFGHLGLASALLTSDSQCFHVGFARRFSGKISGGTRLDFGNFYDPNSVQLDVGVAYDVGLLDEDRLPVQIGLGWHLSQVNVKPGNKSSPMMHFGGEFSFLDHLIQFYPGFAISKRETRLALGVSFFPVDWLALRAGTADLKRQKVAAGMGFEAAHYAVDIAYEPAWKRLHASISVLIGRSPAEKAQKLFNQGKAALEKHQLNLALKYFQNAWDYNPENEFYKKSYRLVERRLQFQKNQCQSLMDEALKYQQEGYFFLAATRYMEVLKKFPDYAPAKIRLKALRPLVAHDIDRLLKKGEDYLNKGELEIARQIFQKILLLDSQNKKAQSLMAQLNAKSREKADAYFYRGLGYYSQRNLKRAESEFQQALAIDPKYEEARVYLGEIEKNNRQKQAQIDSLLQIAARWEEQKRYTRAIDNYIRVLDLDPQNTQAKAGAKRLNAYVKKQLRANLKRSRMALKKGNFSAAESYVRRILKIFPKNKAALALREKINQARTIRLNELLDQAEKARHAGQLSEALQFYQKASSLQPSNKKLKKTISELRGQIELSENLSKGEEAFRQEDFVTAIHYFEEVLRADPENNIAASYLQQAKNLVKKQTKLLLQKGIELYTQENYPEAIRVFSQLLALDPNNKVAREYYQRSVVKQKTINNLK